MSWRAETKHNGQWIRGEETFASEEEAVMAARSTFDNFRRCVDHRATEVREPVTHCCIKYVISPIVPFAVAKKKEAALA